MKPSEPKPGTLAELKERIAEIKAYAQYHNLRVEDVLLRLLRPVPKSEENDPEPNAQSAVGAGDESVCFGTLKAMAPEQEKKMAIALELIIQRNRVDQAIFTQLYRQGYVDKARGGQWEITERGKDLVDRFKIVTNDLGELLGNNVKVLKHT